MNIILVSDRLAKPRSVTLGGWQVLALVLVLSGMVWAAALSLQYALAGFPAVSVPRGLSYDGVPSGLTMISPYLTDVWLLGYAYAFEQAGAWRVPPQIGEPAA